MQGKWKLGAILLLAAMMSFTSVACKEESGKTEQGGSNMEQGDGNVTDKDDPVEETPQVWNEQTHGTIVTRPQVQDGLTTELLRDLNFSQGFNVTQFHSNSSHGVMAGTLDYGGEKAAGDPVWTMAQWGCTHDMTKVGKLTRTGSVLAYDDGGKTLSVDVQKTGTLTMGIKGSEEYTRDADGDIRERTDSTENWPHILIEQSIGYNVNANASHLYMELEYEVTKCESLVDRTKYELDEGINAAQFQWFITLTDTDEASASYGQSMWFGFSMFDTRALDKTPSGMAAIDGGKEDSTGLFIYMFSLAERNNAIEIADTPTAQIGVKKHIKVDILPILATALNTAGKRGMLTGASLDNLRIGSTNIGWELPGNYDAEVEIYGLNMYEEF